MIFETKKKYSIIYADPPWYYKDKASSGKRGVEYKYEVMTLEDICNLPVNDIADENCALFLWITYPNLFYAQKVIESWGFTYKTVAFNWIKTNKKSESLFWGMGSYTRANSEICLLALKGKLARKSAAVHSVVISPIRKHSQKPKEVRTRIVELYGDVPRIELFARDKVEGWDCWGNEV